MLTREYGDNSSVSGTENYYYYYIDPDEETQKFLEEHDVLQKNMQLQLAELEQSMLIKKEGNIRYVLQQAEHGERQHITNRAERSMARHSSLHSRSVVLSKSGSLSKNKNGKENEGESKVRSSLLRTDGPLLGGGCSSSSSCSLSSACIQKEKEREEEQGNIFSKQSCMPSRNTPLTGRPSSLSPSPEQPAPSLEEGGGAADKLAFSVTESLPAEMTRKGVTTSSWLDTEKKKREGDSLHFFFNKKDGSRMNKSRKAASSLSPIVSDLLSGTTQGNCRLENEDKKSTEIMNIGTKGDEMQRVSSLANFSDEVSLPPLPPPSSSASSPRTPSASSRSCCASREESLPASAGPAAVTPPVEHLLCTSTSTRFTPCSGGTIPREEKEASLQRLFTSHHVEPQSTGEISLSSPMDCFPMENDKRMTCLDERQATCTSHSSVQIKAEPLEIRTPHLSYSAPACEPAPPSSTRTSRLPLSPHHSPPPPPTHFSILPQEENYLKGKQSNENERRNKEAENDSTAHLIQENSSTCMVSLRGSEEGKGGEAVEDGTEESGNDIINSEDKDDNLQRHISAVLRQVLLVILSASLWVALLLPDALEVSVEVSPSLVSESHHLNHVIEGRLLGLLVESAAIFSTLLVLFLTEVLGMRGGVRWMFQRPRCILFAFFSGCLLFATGIFLVVMAIPDPSLVRSGSEFLVGGGEAEQGAVAQHSIKSGSSSQLESLTRVAGFWPWTFFQGGKAVKGVGAVLLFLGLLGVTAAEVGFTAGLALQLQLLLLLWPATIFTTFTLAPFLTSYFVSQVDLFRYVVFTMIGVIPVISLLLSTLVPLTILYLVPSSSRDSGGGRSTSNSNNNSSACSHLKKRRKSRCGRRMVAHNNEEEKEEGGGGGGSSLRRGEMNHRVPSIPSGSHPNEDSFLSGVALPEVLNAWGGEERNATSCQRLGEGGCSFQILRHLSSRFLLRVFVLSALMAGVFLLVNTSPVSLAPHYDGFHTKSSEMDSATSNSLSNAEKHDANTLQSMRSLYHYYLVMNSSPEAIVRMMTAAAVMMWPICFIPPLSSRIRYYVPTVLMVWILLTTWGLSLGSVKLVPLLLTAMWTGISLQVLASSLLRSLVHAGTCWKEFDERTTSISFITFPLSRGTMRKKPIDDEEGKKVQSEVYLHSPLLQGSAPEAGDRPERDWKSERMPLLTAENGNSGSLGIQGYGGESVRAGECNDAGVSVKCTSEHTKGKERPVKKKRSGSGSSSGRWRRRSEAGQDASLIEGVGKRIYGSRGRTQQVKMQSMWEGSRGADVEDIFVFSRITTTGRKEKQGISKEITVRPGGPWESFLISALCITFLILVVVLSTAVAWASLVDADVSSADHSPTYAGGVTEDAHHVLVNVLLGLGALALMAEALEVVADRNQRHQVASSSFSYIKAGMGEVERR